MHCNYLTLLDILKDQAKTIKDQSVFIDRLINENLEKENMINVVLEEIESN